MVKNGELNESQMIVNYDAVGRFMARMMEVKKMSFKDCALLILFAALYLYEIRRPLEDEDGEKFYEKMR